MQDPTVRRLIATLLAAQSLAVLALPVAFTHGAIAAAQLPGNIAAADLPAMKEGTASSFWCLPAEQQR